MIFFYIFIFIFGLVVGSFLNCVIYRLEKKESFLFTRSYCPHCEHKLSWYDLIPILSFLILKGKCRYCNQKISWQYPLIEFFTGIIFVLIFHFQFPVFSQLLIFDFSKMLDTLYSLIITCFLIIIFVYDLKHYIIPDKIVYPAIVTALIFNSQFLISKHFSIFGNLILSAFGAALFFFLIVIISKGKWMGVGDIKLAFLMGLILGFPNILVGLFLAFFLGAIIGLGLIILGKKSLKSEIPFGPFLITATFLGLFWGSGLINWYLGLFI